jgi:hypothetical protein
VATATVALVVIDVATGNALGWGTPTGPNPIHGGRFFGLPNIGFAYLAVAALLLTGFALGRLKLAHAASRAVFVLVTAVVAVALTVIDAAPALGADLGGAVAIIPAFAVFALVALRVRLSPWRLVAAVGAGLAAFGAAIVLDWWRGPEQWTHAGAFLEGVLNGEGGDVIVRKGLNALLLTGLAAPLAVGLAIFGRWVWRRLRATEEARAYRRAVPLARAMAGGLAALTALGALANDSGLGGMALGLALATPLLLAAAGPGRG